MGGAYRVVRPVAEGGMGVIYEVEQIATGALRALKAMHGQFATDEKLRSRFVLEARLAASIPSDHVSQVVDAGQDAATGMLWKEELRSLIHRCTPPSCHALALRPILTGAGKRPREM